MNEISQKLYEAGIVPVVKLNDAEKAVPLAKALLDGGLDCVEITFRTDAAEQAIRNITAAYPQILVGAGTVLTCGQVDRAIEAGAKFIVTPGFNPKTVSHCMVRGITVIPGCSDSAALEAAIEMGLTEVKFFPSEQLGGLAMLKALSAPYSQVRFMPTGGVNEKNMLDYLAFDKVIAIGGTWMVKEDLINENRFDEITRLAKSAVQKMLGFHLKHIGLNCASEDEALAIANEFGSIFDFEVRNGNSSVFAGTAFELMKRSGFGAKGHICLETNHMGRACAFLRARGCRIDEHSGKYDAKGNLHVVNLADEVGGFGLQLISK